MINCLRSFTVDLPYAGPIQMRVCDIETVCDREFLGIIQAYWDERLRYEQAAERDWSRDAEDLCHYALDLVWQRRKALDSLESNVVCLTSRQRARKTHPVL